MAASASCIEESSIGNKLMLLHTHHTIDYKILRIHEPIPFAKYEKVQDKQDLYPHIQSPSSRLYLLHQCLTGEEPEHKN